MVDIYVTVNGERKVSKGLSDLASKLSDLRTPNRAAAAQLYQWTIDNYDSEGGKIGGWAPLAPSTVARKARMGKERILVISGYGRASILPFSDDSRAGVGTPVPYMGHHQTGTSRMPQRRFLPDEETTLDIAMRVYGFYVARSVKEATA